MADDSEQIGQNEIEELLRQAQAQNAPKPPNSPASTAPAPSAPKKAAAPAEPASVDPAADVEFLLRQAELALASVDQPRDTPLEGLAPFSLRALSGAAANHESTTIDLIGDVELDVRIELGHTFMQLEEVLRLRKGAVVSLDKLAGDPVDVYVNGRLIARGEVLVLNDNFCIRVAELVAGEEAA